MADLLTTVAADIDSRLAGKTQAVAGPLFSVQNHATATYAWNTDSWLAGVNRTCISVWNSAGETLYAGVAITRRHAVIAWHYPPNLPAGTVFRFVTEANVTVSMTTASVGVRVGPVTDNISSDIQIVTFTADLPESITPCKIVPADLIDYLPRYPNGAFDPRLPIVAILGGGYDGAEPHPNKLATVRELSELSTLVRFAEPAGEPLVDFVVSAIGGDSGGQLFALIDGELNLASTFYSVGAGPFHASRLAAITAITGESYPVTVKSLAGYDLVAELEPPNPDPDPEQTEALVGIFYWSNVEADGNTETLNNYLLSDGETVPETLPGPGDSIRFDDSIIDFVSGPSNGTSQAAWVIGPGHQGNTSANIQGGIYYGNVDQIPALSGGAEFHAVYSGTGNVSLVTFHADASIQSGGMISGPCVFNGDADIAPDLSFVVAENTYNKRVRFDGVNWYRKESLIPAPTIGGGVQY